VNEIFKKLIEDIPGLVIVYGIALSLFNATPESVHLGLLVILLIMSWLLHRLGSVWDPLFFDRIFAPRRQESSMNSERCLLGEIKASLYRSRNEAAQKLRCPITGIYQKAEQ
jgi:hypothetical protein